MDIYKNIELARKNKRISYEKIAQECGLTRMGVYKMFKNKSMSLDNMVKIVEAIGVKPSDIFEDPTSISANTVAEPTPHYGKLTMRQKVAEIQRLAAEIESEMA